MLTPEELKKITRKQFNDAYNKHLPCGWIKFAYKYFSTTTEERPFKLKECTVIVLIILFVIGLLATIFNLNELIILISGIAYSVILSILVIYLFSAIIANNLRINKIRKILGGASKEQYNYLADKFYETK